LGKIFILIALVLVPAVGFCLGESESFRCSKGIVSPGDSMYEVVQKCGEPAYKAASNKRYRYAGKNYYATETWYYDFGPREFVYQVNFNGDKGVILYNTGSYGTRQ
jgi:hypothetical protein